MDTIASSQEGPQNIYQHLITQNNTGTVPDAVVEEEILPQNGQTQSFQVSNQMSPQTYPGNQMKQQLVNVIHSPHQVVNQHSIQQERISQCDPQRSQHSYIPPQNAAAGGSQKVKYVIRPPPTTNQMNSATHGQPKLQSIIQGQTDSQEEILDQAIKMQNQQIVENQKMLEHYKRLGFATTAGNNLQSPQVPNSVSSPANFTVKTMNVMNNSPSVQNNLDVKMVHSGSATNQAKTVLQLNPTGIVNRPRAVTQTNTFVHQGYRPQIIHNNKRGGGGGHIRQQHNPVQVSMVSSNQVQTSSYNSSPLNNINKKNVILEGGGEFEEGQAYVIRNKEGKSQTMLWKNGDFVPLDSPIIQHQVVDSSQRGKGSRGRGGRGRGRGQGQTNMGNRTNNPRGGMRMQFSPPRANQPNMNMRGPNNVVRHNVPQVNHVRHRQPNTIVIQTPYTHPSQPQHNTTSQMTVLGREVASSGIPGQTGHQGQPGQTNQQSQQGGVLTKVDIKNLMPPAQGSQKTAQSSGTNLARDHINQEDNKEEPDKDLTQYLSTSLPTDSQGGKTEVLDPPRIPNDPNAVAVCQFCGYISEDKVKCESCKRNFTSTTKYQVKGTGAPIVEDNGQKKRKLDFGEKIITLSKKAFYGKKSPEQQNQFYHQVIKSANGNVTIAYPSPRIIVRGSRSRGRGRGRGRGMVVPETITLSSDEEEGAEGHHRGSGDAIHSSQSKLSSVGDPSSQQDPPESPLIPNIPISSTKGDSRSRRDKMEDEAGKTQSDREKSTSPVNVLLTASNISVGTFRGVPIEPIVLCKNGLRFFMEGHQSSHRFTILPSEIQQCLAHFSKAKSSYLFFLVNKTCGIRTRKDLGIKFHSDLAKPPPEPYFDPFGADLTHQMITVMMDKIENTVMVEFQKYMDLFKSWGKAGDEAFFMELTDQEADEVLKQSLSVAGHAITYPSRGPDHQYSQGEDDRRSRSPSPPRLGFVGPIIKLLTYPPPPEKRGISITNEDLYCLQEGEFLNDVIIDFYLKYLHMEKLNEKDKERTHIFSSFFYKRLTQRIRGAAIDDDPNLPLPVKRHARVKTWTRHVDLFKKDFIIIPINEHAHWFLAIICYPWMMEPSHNRYIPNRSITPSVDPDSINIPTPPQPTDENTDDMEEDQENPNPQPDQQSQVPETPSVTDTSTSTNNTQSTETEQVSQPSQDQNGTLDSGTTNGAEDGSTENAENTDRHENMEVEQKEDPLQTDSERTDTEPMDTSEKSSDEGQGESEKSQEDAEKTNDQVSQETEPERTETQTPSVVPKLGQGQKLQNIRPIRGQPVEEGDNCPQEDVLVGTKQPCILIFDSLSGPSRSRIVTVLKEYLQVEWQVKKAEEMERELNKAAIRGCVPKVPQQNNYSDCGVFMLQYVESFFEDPIQDFSTPMKGLHDWFSLQKIEGKREWLRDLIISLKEKYESKTDSVDNT